MAAISDKITKTMSNQNPATTTVAAQRAVGATELRGVNLDGWQDETATHFITYKVDAQGELIEGSQADWKGIVNLQSNSIVNLKRTGGAADQGNAIGDVIEPAPTAAYGNDLAEALLEHHDTEGRLKPNTVTYDHIDEKTEYKYIASPNDLNDAQFLVPGKWRFGNNQQVGSTKNLPLANNTGVMETISHSGGATQPGTHAQSSVLQIFTTLDGRMFIRRISTAESASSVTYGAWQEFVKGFAYDTTKATPTGDVWVNGKPIMRLTVDVGKLPNSGNKEVAAKIPKNATVVGISGVANGPEGAYPLPYVHESTAWVIRLTYNSTTQKMNVYSAGDRSGQSGYVFIDYVEA